VSVIEAEPQASDVPVSEEHWEEQGRDIARRANATAWEIGDWLVEGEALDGEPTNTRRYEKAVKLSGLAYGTLRNRACVARAFDRSRRRDTLTFAHHAAVPRKKDANDANAWLDKAEQNGWSEKVLRLKVSEANGKVDPKARPTRLILSIQPPVWDRWIKASGNKDMKAWVIETVNAALGEGES
jgi:hypothetical protein